MKVLFATINDGSFLNPMVPLAWALRTAGHDVRVACQAYAVPHVLAAGLTAVPVGRQASADRLLTAMQVTPEMLAEARPGLHPPYDAVDDLGSVTLETLVAGYEEDTERLKYENFPMIAGLVAFAREWQPDLIVWEPFTPAGAIAAKACGAAHARVLFGMDAFGVVRQKFLELQSSTGGTQDPLGDWLGSYARKFGATFTEDMTCGHFTIDHYPAAIQLEASGLHYVHSRFVAYGGRTAVPGWLRTPPGRPRVVLTMGFTASGFFDGFPFSLQEVLDELGSMDIEVIAVLDEFERAKLTTVPTNTRVESWVPLDAVAATCSAAVTHAGGGTASSFVTHGVPQLTLPFHFDEPILGRNLAAAGAGLNLDPRTITRAAVRESLHRLLSDPQLIDGARALSDSMRALPTPNELTGTLEDLAAQHRS